MTAVMVRSRTREKIDLRREFPYTQVIIDRIQSNYPDLRALRPVWVLDLSGRTVRGTGAIRLCDSGCRSLYEFAGFLPYNPTKSVKYYPQPPGQRERT
jgi:hypothetical protein